MRLHPGEGLGEIQMTSTPLTSLASGPHSFSRIKSRWELKPHLSSVSLFISETYSVLSRELCRTKLSWVGVSRILTTTYINYELLFMLIGS